MKKSHLAFVGSIPEYYDKYFGPLIFEYYAYDLANRVSVKPDGNVLEIAAGTGIVSKHLRDLLPKEAKIMVTDLNQPMLDFSKTKFKDQNNMRFQTEDALNMSFPSDTFDEMISQFSIMFFPDKLASFKEAKRVLKPGGKYIFNIWDSYEYNHLANTVNNAIQDLFPEDSIGFYDVPYCYYQIDTIKNLLIEAGFKDIEISVLPRISSAKNARDVAKAFILGTPISLQIIEQGKDLDPILNKVENAISEEYGHSSIEAKMQAIVFEASL